MKKKILFITIISLISFKIKAQENFNFNHYTQYSYLLNPAMAGNNEYGRIFFNHNNQWGNMPSAPQKSTFAFDYQLKSKKYDHLYGIGLYHYNRQMHIFNTQSAGITAAPQLKLSQKWHLSFGLSLGFFNQKIDFGNSNSANLLDPDIFNSNISQGMFDYNFGFNLNHIFEEEDEKKIIENETDTFNLTIKKKWNVNFGGAFYRHGLSSFAYMQGKNYTNTNYSYLPLQNQSFYVTFKQIRLKRSKERIFFENPENGATFSYIDPNEKYKPAKISWQGGLYLFTYGTGTGTSKYNTETKYTYSRLGVPIQANLDKIWFEVMPSFQFKIMNYKTPLQFSNVGLLAGYEVTDNIDVAYSYKVPINTWKATSYVAYAQTHEISIKINFGKNLKRAIENADSLDIMYQNIKELESEVSRLSIAVIDGISATIQSNVKKQNYIKIIQDKGNRYEFELNDTKIQKKPKSEEELFNAISKLLENTDSTGYCFVIEGHADKSGEDSTNSTLSKQRADTIKNLFDEKYHDQILTAGRGESQPIEKNDTTERINANRRVEFYVFYNKDNAQLFCDYGDGRLPMEWWNTLAPKTQQIFKYRIMNISSEPTEIDVTNLLDTAYLELNATKFTELKCLYRFNNIEYLGLRRNGIDEGELKKIKGDLEQKFPGIKIYIE